MEDIADEVERIDPDGRPLFVQVATMNWLDSVGGNGGHDNALRRLIARADQQDRLGEPGGDAWSQALARNVQVFTTAVGGLSVEEYASAWERLSPSATLLPRGASSAWDLDTGRACRRRPPRYRR